MVCHLEDCHMSLRPSLSVLSDGTSPLAVLLLLIFFLMKNVYKSDERDVFKRHLTTKARLPRRNSRCSFDLISLYSYRLIQFTAGLSHLAYTDIYNHVAYSLLNRPPRWVKYSPGCCNNIMFSIFVEFTGMSVLDTIKTFEA
jgi:hypothetical protein